MKGLKKLQVYIKEEEFKCKGSPEKDLTYQRVADCWRGVARPQ